MNRNSGPLLRSKARIDSSRNSCAAVARRTGGHHARVHASPKGLDERESRSVDEQSPLSGRRRQLGNPGGNSARTVAQLTVGQFTRDPKIMVDESVSETIRLRDRRLSENGRQVAGATICQVTCYYVMRDQVPFDPARLFG
jgi:hypothetical protein